MGTSALVVALALVAPPARADDAPAAPSCTFMLRELDGLVAGRGRIALAVPAAPGADDGEGCPPPEELGRALEGAAPTPGVQVCTVSDRKIAVAATGPSGTGRFWSVAIGAGAARGAVARACLETTTAAWRNLPPELRKPGAAPRWDVCPADLPGRLEIWDSVRVAPDADATGYALVSLVYQLSGLELVLDDGATRRRAAELAVFYRRAAALSRDRLHAEAADMLEAFGRKTSCPARPTARERRP